MLRLCVVAIRSHFHDNRFVITQGCHLFDGKWFTALKGQIRVEFRYRFVASIYLPRAFHFLGKRLKFLCCLTVAVVDCFALVPTPYNDSAVQRRIGAEKVDAFDVHGISDAALNPLEHILAIQPLSALLRKFVIRAVTGRDSSRPFQQLFRRDGNALIFVAQRHGIPVPFEDFSSLNKFCAVV